MWYRKLSALLLITFASNARAQLIIDTSLTPAQIVQDVLLGSGITVSNITYKGYKKGIATFTA